MPTKLLGLAALACLGVAAGCASQRNDHLAPAALEVAIDPQPTGFEADAHGFPAMRTLEGRPLADGDFTQWLDGDRLHIKIHYEFGPDRWVEENSVVRQTPTLVQERWSWVEMRAGSVQRRFEVDFLTGNATAEKLEDGELKHWSKHLDVEPGRVFAGSAWSLAIKSVRSRLLRGEKIEFQGVGFTPKPRAGTVEISHAGVDRIPMSGRTVEGDHFRIHPKVPWIARAFVDVPDSHMWLVQAPPAAFLRWEGPLAEPDDELVRVDLLPGEPSGPASPVSP
jgi:hypothetical protein